MNSYIILLIIAAYFGLLLSGGGLALKAVLERLSGA